MDLDLEPALENIDVMSNGVCTSLSKLMVVPS